MRHKITCLLLFILAYLIMGAVAPFFAYPKIDGNTAGGFGSKSFRMNGTGPERTALLETNMSAWEAVSYTHLDVYKRQGISHLRPYKG